MKTNGLLLLVMVISFASSAKAQFYDGPDDIYFYVEEVTETDQYYINYGGNMLLGTGGETIYTGKVDRKVPDENSAKVYVFNFDGKKAALLGDCYVSTIKSNLSTNSSFYEDKVETTNYSWQYVSSSSSGVIYKSSLYGPVTFSKDRQKLTKVWNNGHGRAQYKRVDKSYFRIGRSRKPSSTIYE